MRAALEAIGEAYLGVILAGFTIAAAVAWSKRRLIRSVAKARRR